MLILNTGTQYVEGVLSFDPGFQIFVYDSVFSASGDYVIFDYSSGSFPGGQAELNSNVTVIGVDLSLSYVSPAGGTAVLENQPEHSRIILKLLSKPTNGKQWVEGDLNFEGPTTLYLTDHLYANAGVYELFEVTGEIYNLQNLTVIHEAGFLFGDPYIDPLNNKIVKIGLAKTIGLNGSNVSQSYAYPPTLEKPFLSISIETNTVVVSSVYSFSVVQKLNTAVATSQCIAYPASIEKIKTSAECATSISKCFDPVAKHVISISKGSSSAYSPDCIAKIKTQTSVVISNVFRLRSDIGESNWYDYFPMASFDGLISLESEFKIMLLNEGGTFNSSNRYIADISSHKVGNTKNISLKDVYVDSFGRVVYDFDSVNWGISNFTFSNAVIFANDILVLHINWAKPFILLGQDLTLDIPRSYVLAQPTMRFGTLDFEPYIRYPAKASAVAISPMFPYVYPEVAKAYGLANPIGIQRLEPEFTIVSSSAFPLQIVDVVEADDPIDLIELEEEDFTVVESFAFDPNVIQNLNNETSLVISSAFPVSGPSIEKIIEEFALVVSEVFSPEIIQKIHLTHSNTVCQTFEVKFPRKNECAFATSSAFSPDIIQSIKPGFAVSTARAISQSIRQNIDISCTLSYSRCLEDHSLKKVITPCKSTYSHVFSPHIVQTIAVVTATAYSKVQKTRIAKNESNWYDYFPMASFDGLISLDSEFKIMLLDREGEFISSQRYISDISSHKVGTVKRINLLRTYINNYGEAIYDFDSPSWDLVDFTFSNAVIFANDILVLHISWANPITLSSQNLILDLPGTYALARPTMRFGTLDFEPYVRYPAKASAIAINPMFPYVWPDVAKAYGLAFHLSPLIAEVECATGYAIAFPLEKDDLFEEPEDGAEIISSDDDFTPAYAIAIDPNVVAILEPECATGYAKAFPLAGPPIVKEIEDNCLSYAIAIDPNVVAILEPECAIAIASSFETLAKYIIDIETAIVVASEVCPPVVYQPPVTQPEPPRPPVIKPIKCADPFYEWKPKVSKVYDLNPSKLEAYWTLDNHLRDESLNRRNLTFVSVGSEFDLGSYETGKIGQGYRGYSYMQDNLAYSDFLESNHSFDIGRNFSVQMWFKVDFDDILMDKNVALIEQMSWCWNNGASFPGSVGWALHSSCNSERILFQFSIADGKSCIKTNAGILLGEDFQLSQRWHHIVFTKEGHQTFLYVDGIQYGSSAGEREVQGNEGEDHAYRVIDGISLKIGNSSTSYLSPLLTTNSPDLTEEDRVLTESIVDDIAIWGKSLTQSEVSRLWLGGDGSRADSLPHKTTVINTSEFNRFRQGVELTHPLHYNVGLYKIYSGVRDTHRKFPGDFGNTKPIDSCNKPFVDIRGWNPIDYVKNYPNEYFITGEKPITDGVIKITNSDNVKPEIMIGSLIGTNIKINELPGSPYIDNGYNNNEPNLITPFIDDEIQIEGYNPSGYISQGNGYDHEASTTRGVDSIAYGGMTY